MAEISADDLGLLVSCACDYDTRLPYGVVPGHVWSLLTPLWQERVTDKVAERERRDGGKRYSFTRDQLIEAIGRLEAYPAAAGPGHRSFIVAESMADAIIEALEGGSDGT